MGSGVQRNRILYIFTHKNLTSSGSDSNDFPDDQLAKFRNLNISRFLWQIDMDVYFAA